MAQRAVLLVELQALLERDRVVGWLRRGNRGDDEGKTEPAKAQAPTQSSGVETASRNVHHQKQSPVGGGEGGVVRGPLAARGKSPAAFEER